MTRAAIDPAGRIQLQVENRKHEQEELRGDLLKNKSDRKTLETGSSPTTPQLSATTFH